MEFIKQYLINMKEIQGKIKMIVVPLPKGVGDVFVIHGGTRAAYFEPNYKRFDIPKNEYTIVGKLSELTEDQCINLVEGYGVLNGWRNYLVESQYMECLTPTAKESLVSLLKANDCLTKEWAEEPNPIDFDIFGLFDAADRFDEAIKKYERAPEDYLILRVKSNDVYKEEIG